MNIIIKLILKVLIQIGIGASIIILLNNPLNFSSTIKGIIFLILWVPLWVIYDYITRSS